MNRFVILAAASVAIGGWQIAQAEDNVVDRAAQQTENAAEKTGEAIGNAADRVGDAMTPDSDHAVAGSITLPAGITRTETDDAEGIRDVVATSTEAALTKGGFDDLVERLVDADRNRIGDFAEQDMTELDGRIQQIRDAWQAKYNEEFDIEDEEAVYGVALAIVQGEVSDPALVQGNWPVRSTPSIADRAANAADEAMNGDAQPAAARENMDDAASPNNRNLEQGREVAVIEFAESHGQPSVVLSLIHENPDNWRIDIPDDVSGQELADNLLAQLTIVGDSAASWPADKNDAYRLVTHHVLLGLEGVSADTASDATGDGFNDRAPAANDMQAN
jgi:hypothetical protein